MWQKINPVGIDELENTRIHLHKALQLVSAAARSFLPDSDDDQNAKLQWVPKNKIFRSKSFGDQKDIFVLLDPEKFIITIQKGNKSKEHLVLSGMTYPLAFGWLQVKLDKFGLDSEQFSDETPYELTNYGFEPSKELQINQRAADELTKHFSNAYELFVDTLGQEIKTGEIFIRPQNFDLVLEISNADPSIPSRIGFSPGDENYIEPYFYLAVNPGIKIPDSPPDLEKGLWNKKDWTGILILSSDYINLEPEREKQNVIDFLRNGVKVIAGLKP
jgi:hypothetical protein